MSLQLSNEAVKLLQDALRECRDRRHEFLTPEHLLLAFFRQAPFAEVFALSSSVSGEAVCEELRQYIDGFDTVPAPTEEEEAAGIEDCYNPETSFQTQEALDRASSTVALSSAEELRPEHILNGLLKLEDSHALYILSNALDGDTATFLADVISAYGGGCTDAPQQPQEMTDAPQTKENWRDIVVCINDMLDPCKPLIGRKDELERTIRVLCRREKNNPLHVGEPGVGKTALVYGLARMIENGEVPERLKHSRIYRLDIGPLLAGTQYRGDMEKKIKQVMDGLSHEPGAIVYIDEIHTLVGAGATGEGSMDASNMLKPYLESGEIRFIGATTYEEYNRYFSRNKSLVRRFQQIDILEPSVEETIDIARQLQPGYEDFHNVVYTPEAIEYAVTGAARHITDRFLPDKALDLIDEAGAYRELHPTEGDVQTVDRQLISEILSKVCKVDALAVKEEQTAAMSTLRERISASIYGQDDAVRSVAEAVEMSKAGLTDDGKPIASLLFVGPTGVGKTEVARVLARELGVELIRFDMSEYMEKHTVAKLIGAPAGYVGYDDGGLLVDAIRRTPDCVLLLDEIEKAHSDIYNILLQVMDYARLTDNRGRHADFRNVIIIMTSNAGAQFARSSVGFNNDVQAGQVMMREIRKVFKPEFINRLSATVIFRDMDMQMASMILDKKLRELAAKASAKGIQLTVSGEVRQLLLEEGFTRQYGAREMGRVIAARLKPLLMREILYGSLRDGGAAEAVADDGKIILRVSSLNAKQ